MITDALTPHSAQAVGYRAQLLYFKGRPAVNLSTEDDPNVVYHTDGLLLVADGKVIASGDYDKIAPTLAAGTVVHDLRGKLIMPGFIDTHIHYPQTDIIASPAPDLLPWLETYTFPTEGKFGDEEHAAEVSRFFLDELLSNGTTSAMVYCTSHKSSVNAFFDESHKRNLRMIAGKVLMDRNCPDFLKDTAVGGAKDSEELIQQWHGKGRQLYSLTPRFAPTSTPEQLGACSELAKAYPEVYLQTHVAESKAELKWVSELFPGYRSYLDIYDQYGLLRPRSMYGHCIWLDETDRGRMRDTQSVAAHCPTSNLFLGSGLFNFAAADESNMLYTVATDVGGGSSFSMLRTMDEAHKIGRLGAYHLDAKNMFYLSTAGAATALDLEGVIGSLAAGTEADFIVLDPHATPLLTRRTDSANTLEELLFAFALLGDDRSILATYVAGVCRHERDTPREAYRTA